MSSDENTPLLNDNGDANGNATGNGAADVRNPPARGAFSWFKASHRVLLSGFIVALTFTITQVP